MIDGVLAVCDDILEGRADRRALSVHGERPPVWRSAWTRPTAGRWRRWKQLSIRV
jgi:hypothetical protein